MNRGGMRDTPRILILTISTAARVIDWIESYCTVFLTLVIRMTTTGNNTILMTNASYLD